MIQKELTKNNSHPYRMKIERTIVDKLGLNMYDKVSAVVAELIANSFDADAETVVVKLPLGKALAVHTGEGLEQKGYTIEIVDDGFGMTPQEANEFYLRVGIDRRKNPKLGATSREKGRQVLGRKGIGKLAPFGICRKIEVRSAGGEKTERGYLVTHFELNYDKIIEQTEGEDDEEYHPTPLSDDSTWDKNRGTRVVLKNFNAKNVPNKDTFHRQLSARFGLQMPDFKIIVQDMKEENTEEEFEVGQLEIRLMEGTRIDLSDRPVISNERTEYPVKGWVGMAKQPYKNEEIAGIRIYARGKIVSITRDFGVPSGFSGEFAVRSYLVGEIHADWLDGEEDLIQTHRQDILWSSDLGQAFSEWGKELVKEVARRGRQPRRDKVRAQFMIVSKLEERARERFKDSELQDTAIAIGEKLGEFASEEELTDQEYVDGLAELILTVAPHKLLVDTFKKINEMAVDGKISVDELLKLFKTTKIAQLASYGQVVQEKIKTIDIFEKSIRSEETEERDLQEILETSPWLINSRWELSVANRSLKTFQESFEGWYEKTYEESVTTTTQITEGRKRPDFIFLHRDNMLVILEIKPPNHTFNDDDWSRLEKYYDAIGRFFKENPQFSDSFPKGHKVILVRDKEKVNSTVRKAMDGLIDKEHLEPHTWEELLENTKKDHESFLVVRDSFDES